MNNAGTKLKIK